MLQVPEQRHYFVRSKIVLKHMPNYLSSMAPGSGSWLRPARLNSHVLTSNLAFYLASVLAFCLAGLYVT
jgi:hypothetical protein